MDTGTFRDYGLVEALGSNDDDTIRGEHTE
jgi:hypothetical protein